MGLELNDDDVQNGIMIYSAIIYCETGVVKLFKFLDSLLSTESQRTILKAVVNTIESGNLEGVVNDNLILEFYKVLENKLDLQFGKILLATLSGEQLQDMMNKKSPFIAPFSKTLENFFNRSSCQEVRDIMNTLGR